MGRVSRFNLQAWRSLVIPLLRSDSRGIDRHSYWRASTQQAMEISNAKKGRQSWDDCPSQQVMIDGPFRGVREDPSSCSSVLRGEDGFGTSVLWSPSSSNDRVLTPTVLHDYSILHHIRNTTLVPSRGKHTDSTVNYSVLRPLCLSLSPPLDKSIILW